MARFALAALLFVAAVAALDHWRWRRFRELDRNGRPATAWVTGKSEGKDGRVHYAFNALDRVYTGHDTVGQGTPELSRIQPGDEVVVFYDSRDPDVSCLGNPRERLRDQHHTLVYVLLVAAPVLGLALRREWAKASA